MAEQLISNDKMLDELQRDSFGYFIHEVNPENGLVVDKTRQGWPASIAATGIALTAYLVGVERGWMTRDEAIQRTLTTLRFFWNSPQGQEPGATGYKGFYYHYLDMKTGQRTWNCELSTIDTAFLLAGALTAARYFNQDSEEEHKIRSLADQIYRRVDWRWAQNGQATVSHGWKPESGFLSYRWKGYDESLLLYVFGLGSPTYPLPRESYAASAASYAWKKVYDIEFLYGGPLFVHQYPHMWLDLRDIQDDFMRVRESNYFENSRRATYIQQQYAIRNPQEYAGYGENCWGITASDGPGPATMKIDEIERVFYDYIARGAPYGPDDGTIAPWATVASLPFAPEIVLPAIRYFDQLRLKENIYGYKATFNLTYPDRSRSEYGWVSPYHFGINQGPIVLMIENYRSEFIWRLMRQCSYVVEGLRRAGFTGGWL